ncbi:MAG: alpha-L-rhamnosidase C-terminal domain-containing protein, partial [Prolixibacteraceae bacterium]
FKNIILRPSFFRELDDASASHQSPYGKIVSQWKREGKKLFYTIVIPANSTADLYLPEGYLLKKVKLTNSNDHVTLQQNAGDCYKLLAGSYELELTNDRK